MHELSIAESLIDVARQHLPPAAQPRTITVHAGPLRAIEPDAMEWAWRAATEKTEFASTKLDLVELPWRLHCLTCRRDWDADHMNAACACGSTNARPIGGDELQLMSMDVAEAQTTENLK
jgi:hydrogenase nickel incorporation protein HypA/HybF